MGKKSTKNKKSSKEKLKHQPYLRFKGYLVENRIKQTEIAKLLNLSPVTVSQKINGYLHFTFPEVEKICDKYGLSADFFREKSYAKATNQQV